MSEVTSKYRGSKAYHLLYCELINAARARTTISYKTIAKIMGLPPSGNYMSKETGHILGEISEDEHLQGRPMLSAIAINTSGTPGSGFFELAKSFGKLTDGSSEGQRRFLETEQAQVYLVWQNADDKQP